MAAKSKKRLSKIENKQLKLDKLEHKDIICTICHSILIEPVTLPCYHNFCYGCFQGSIENNALCCPLCRLRIGSWLRTATKQKNLVNTQLWTIIQNKFSKEIDKKLRGEDTDSPTDVAIALPRLCAPGEIRSEYEAELKRLREERLRLEQKQLYESELLIRKLQHEEEEAHKKYLEKLKRDETLAKEIRDESKKIENTPDAIKKRLSLDSRSKIRLKPTKIDSFLTKVNTSVKESSLLPKDFAIGSTSRSLNIPNNVSSPIIFPTCGKVLKPCLEKKLKTETKIWNKENGEKTKKDDDKGKEKSALQKKNSTLLSLLVKLPLPQMPPGIVHQSNRMIQKRNLETGSVDSMQQELCYFKPIEGTTPTSFISNKDLPLRVPVLRVDNNKSNNVVAKNESPPSRDKYLEGLYNLRHLSISHKLPSAFVLGLSILRTKKDHSTKCLTNSKLKVKKSSPVSSHNAPLITKGSKNKQMMNVDDMNSLEIVPSLRRTRSMGSIPKDEQEKTPKKKIKERKANSERKPYLRSDSKKMCVKKGSCSPVLLEESINNNNKVKLAMKNLTSPLDNCDVKSILQEQLRIERIIEQEKSDLEFAQKVDAEWNGRRPRRAANKRQVTINYALRPAKKLKV